MSPVQKTGLYYPNKFGLIIIKSLEEVMGRNGLNAILNLAGLNNYIENYPPDNLDKGFDFAELSAVGVALEEMYGPRWGPRSCFARRTRNFLRCPEELRRSRRCSRSGFRGASASVETAHRTACICKDLFTAQRPVQHSRRKGYRIYLDDP